MQYCTCTYRWNLSGWNKAITLWGFVLTTALGVQRLLVQLVLQGLLPGEQLSPPAALLYSTTCMCSFVSCFKEAIPCHDVDMLVV